LVGASAAPRTWLGKERKPKSNLDSVYHVINNACIHLRVKCLNIYMYRRGEYIKNLLKKYNNRTC
jgi:hypothetical protein